MKTLISTLIIFLLLNSSIAEELDETRGPSEYFHQVIHVSEELYVARLEKSQKSTWANGAGEKYVVSAVIEHVIKGKKFKSDRFEFTRTYDSFYEKNRFPIGELRFVSFQKIDGTLKVDPQDSNSVWPFSEQRLKVAKKHEGL